MNDCPFTCAVCEVCCRSPHSLSSSSLYRWCTYTQPHIYIHHMVYQFSPVSFLDTVTAQDREEIKWVHYSWFLGCSKGIRKFTLILAKLMFDCTDIPTMKLEIVQGIWICRFYVSSMILSVFFLFAEVVSILIARFSALIVLCWL